MEDVPGATKHDLNASARRPQYFATFCASLGALAAGAVLGYASPASFQLREFNPLANTSQPAHPPVAFVPKSTPFHDHDLDHFVYNTSHLIRFKLPNRTFEVEQNDGPPDKLTLNLYELSWFSASLNIGALVGSILASPMLNFMGRKGAMIASTVPCLFGWMLLGFSRNVILLIVGRILHGLFMGITCVSVNTFVGEIASSDIRGRLGISFQMMVNFGIAYAYTFGSFTTWYNLSFICCVPTVLFAILMAFVKESPLHLLAKGRKEEAAEALQFFRGKEYDITKELEDLDASRKETLKKKFSWSELRQPYILRPVLTVMGLMLFQQVSGINAVLFNMETILQSTSHLLPPEWSTVLSGVTLSASDILTVMLIDTVGRKSLLIASAIGMALTQGCIGFFFFYLERVDEAFAVQYLSWLPVVAVMVFLVAFSVGFGAVPWVIMGEVLPPSIRETAGALVTLTAWTVSFAVTFSFEPLQMAMHGYGYFWMLAAFNAVAAIFSVLVLFETKGKTLHEISVMFGNT